MNEDEGEKIELFWQAYLATLPQYHEHRFTSTPDAWAFGNCSQMANELGRLVLNRIKTATCSLYQGENTANDDARLSIVLDGSQNPLCIIETYEITVRHYRDIDEEFAAAEGEGDFSLVYWRKAHWQFFFSEANKIGLEVSKDMLLICERFRVIYPL